MKITKDDFRLFCPNVHATEAEIDLWLSEAMGALPESRWRNLWRRGVVYYAAYNIVLMQMIANGGLSGLAGMTGTPTSKSVDGISQSYNSGAISSDNPGIKNACAYGLLYIDLAQKVGIGALII